MTGGLGSGDGPDCPASPLVHAAKFAIPAATPTAPPPDDLSSQVTESLLPLPPRKTSSHSPSLSGRSTRVQATPRRISKQHLETLRQRLSARDIAVLTTVHDYRFASTKQLERWHFWQHASAESGSRVARRVLERLGSSNLLRVIDGDRRRVGGINGGSEQPIWCLTEAGHRLLRENGTTDRSSRGRFHEPSHRLLDHCWAIGEAALAVTELARISGDIDGVELQTEPASWRRYHGPDGVTLIRPDLGAVVLGREPSGQAVEDRWFLEIDRGGMHELTIIDRCRQYQQYRATGREQDAHDVFPIVVWVMHTARRADSLSKAIASARTVDARLFRVTTLAELGGLIAGGAA